MRKPSYKRAMDALYLPPEGRVEIRNLLCARLREQKEENSRMKTSRQHTRLLVVAIAAAVALALAGFAFGQEIVVLLGGGRWWAGTDEAGRNVVSMDTGFARDPAEVRDGRVYFVLDGLELDITQQCTAETCFTYEVTAEDGTRHTVLVGGEPEALGWAEYVWDADGTFLGSNATYPSESIPAWLERGEAALGL